MKINKTIRITGMVLMIGLLFTSSILPPIYGFNPSLTQTANAEMADNYDISNVTLNNTYQTSYSNLFDIEIADNGTKAYVLTTTGTIYQYKLSTPYDVSTATEVGSASVYSSARGIQIKSDGSRLILLTKDYLADYTFSTNWDISTISVEDNIQIYDPSRKYGLEISDNGKKLLVSGQDSNGNGAIAKYSLGTAWNANTATFKKQYDIGPNTELTGIRVKNNGTKVFVTTASTYGKVYQYDLSTAWNFSTVTKSYNTSVKDNEKYPHGIDFEKDGKYMYIIGNDNNTMLQYDVKMPEKKYSLDGYVEDSNGNALNNATVKVKQSGSIIAKTTTDAKGYYQFSSITEGEYNITAIKSGYNSKTKSIILDSNTQTNFTLYKKATIFAKVVDKNGDPIENANITVIENGSIVLETQTKTNGNFSASVGNGTYTVNITKYEYTQKSLNVTVEGNTYLGNITIKKKEYNLAFHVTDWLNYSDKTTYNVYFNGEPVNATKIVVNNTSLLTLYQSNNTIIATSNTNLTGETNVTAYYEVDGKNLSVTKQITVAPLKLKYIKILPPLYSTFAFAKNTEFQYLLLMIVSGIGITYVSNAFGGIGGIILLSIVGWIAGWTSLGLVLAGLFGGMFIMLNTNLGLYEGGKQV